MFSESRRTFCIPRRELAPLLAWRSSAAIAAFDRGVLGLAHALAEEGHLPQAAAEQFARAQDVDILRSDARPGGALAAALYRLCVDALPRCGAVKE